MPYVHVIWFCFSVSRATLEVLITLSWLVILALILFCGLSQGLGPLYFFYKNLFFPLVTDCYWNADSYVIGSLWSRYQRRIMDHWSESEGTAANSFFPPPHPLGTSVLLCNPSWMAWAENREGNPDLFPGLHLLVHVLSCLHYIARCNSGSCKNSHFPSLKLPIKASVSVMICYTLQTPAAHGN